MKRFYLLISLSILSITAFGQSNIPNYLFKHWIHTPSETVGIITYPEYWTPAPADFWTSGNPSTRTIKYDPTCIPTTDAYEGETAVLLKSTSFPFGIAAGGLMTGRYLGGLDPNKVIDWGVPWTGRPERFVGYYKYIPVDNDKARVYAFFTKFSGGVRDTVGEVRWTAAMESNTVTSYTKFDIPVTWYNGDNPDTIIMALSSSFDGQNYNGGNGSSLYLDKLLMLQPGETSVNYTEKADAHFWVFPNPVTTLINFTIDPDYISNTKILLHDMNGRLVRTFEVDREFNEYKVEDLTPGTYNYSIFHEDQLISQGKISKQ